MYLSVEKAMSKFGWNRAEAIKVFKYLEKKQVARMKVGRRGWPTRVESR